MKIFSRLIITSMAAAMTLGIVGCSTTKQEPAPPPAPEPVVEPKVEPMPEPEPAPPPPAPVMEPKPDRG